MTSADLADLSDRELADLDDVCAAMLRLELRVSDAMMGGSVGATLTAELAEFADDLCARRTRATEALAAERCIRRTKRLAELNLAAEVARGPEHRITQQHDGVKCECGAFFWGENAVARAIDHKEGAVNRG